MRLFPLTSRILALRSAIGTEETRSGGIGLGLRVEADGRFMATDTHILATYRPSYLQEDEKPFSSAFILPIESVVRAYKERKSAPAIDLDHFDASPDRLRIVCGAVSWEAERLEAPALPWVSCVEVRHNPREAYGRYNVGISAVVLAKMATIAAEFAPAKHRGGPIPMAWRFGDPEGPFEALVEHEGETLRLVGMPCHVA